MRRRFLNKINKSISIGNGEYFTIEALEDGLTANLSTNVCEYRIDDGDWTSLSANSNTLAINTEQKIQFKMTEPIISTSSGIGTFTVSKKCNLKGNIMSLLYGDDFKGQTHLIGKKDAFRKLFYNCKTVVDVSELILPATMLASNCYDSMFNGCTGLTSAPELPATTLASDCYCYMFKGCTSLTASPALPATVLASGCYRGMFSGTNVLPDCSNIDFTNKAVVTSGGLQELFMGTKVTDVDLERILPKNNKGKYCLPATTLANSCYDSMFKGCTSLTTAPDLPATMLASNCYASMFNGCTGLTTAPELPATTLANYCYCYMFKGCTSLTQSPDLPATKLTLSCYYFMFNGCSKLNYIKMLATIGASNCFANWVSGVASTGTFVKHPDMTSLQSGTSGIPSGWTVVNDGEESGAAG